MASTKQLLATDLLLSLFNVIMHYSSPKDHQGPYA